MNEDTPPPSLVDLIDRLVEVPEPAPISLLPQTAGWAVVGALLLVLLAWWGWRRIARYRANAYRREALVELGAAGDDAAMIAAIVRRTALAAYRRPDVAGLSGESWLAFLDAHARGTSFGSGQGRVLAEAPYRGPADVPGLNALARDWVRQHEAPRA